MPGRPGGEFRALEQRNVGPSLQGQMIERADAHHAAADDDDAGMSFHWTVSVAGAGQCNQRPRKQDAICDDPVFKCVRPLRRISRQRPDSV